MEKRAINADDALRYGHAQLSLVIAEILGRHVKVIVPDAEWEDETTYAYSPGFAATFTELGETELPGVRLFFTFIAFFSLKRLFLIKNRPRTGGSDYSVEQRPSYFTGFSNLYDEKNKNLSKASNGYRSSNTHLIVRFCIFIFLSKLFFYFRTSTN